jgi:predicted Zn-dependent protease
VAPRSPPRADYDTFGLMEVLQDIGDMTRDDNRIRLLFKTRPQPYDRLVELDRAQTSRRDSRPDSCKILLLLDRQKFLIPAIWEPTGYVECPAKVAPPDRLPGFFSSVIRFREFVRM